MPHTENIFRFISVRQPNLTKKKSRFNLYVYEENVPSGLFRELQNQANNSSSLERLKEIASKFQETSAYFDDINDNQFSLDKFLIFIDENSHKPLETAFHEMVENYFGKSLEILTSDNDFLILYYRLCDSVLCDIITEKEVKFKEEKILAIKIFYLIKHIGEKRFDYTDNEIISDFLVQSRVIFPSFKSTPSQKEPSYPTDQTQSIVDQKIDPNQQKREYVEKLGILHRELTVISQDEQYRKMPKYDGSNSKKADNSSNTTFWDVMVKVVPFFGRYISSPVENNISQEDEKLNREFILSEKGLEKLSAESKQILSQLNIDQSNLNPFKTVSKVEDEINYTQQSIVSDFKQNNSKLIGNTWVKYQSLSLGHILPHIPLVFPILDLSKCRFEVGMGDLLIVRQTLKAYELSEFAHVENALIGEFRERVHKRLDLTEIETKTTIENEIEKERNLQSTERNEMQFAAEDIVEKQSKIEGNASVKSKYGKTEFFGSASAGFSHSSRSTVKRATNYAKEISEKASEKVREKFTQENRKRILNQIEESNTHRIDNTGRDSHVRGIYRWLNKIYDAQIFNYGKRMLYEFVIPEPAAYYIYTQIQNSTPDIEITEPQPPTFPINGGTPLKPSHITRTNYHNYISKYNVTNAPEPPSHFIVKSFHDSQHGDKEQHFAKSDIIHIPDFYEAYGALVQTDIISRRRSTNSDMQVDVGGQRFRNSIGYRSFDGSFRGEISIAVSFLSVKTYIVAVDVFCRLTIEGFEKWQLQIFDLIMNAYLEQKATYDAKLEQHKIQNKEENDFGRNPIENRRIERNELKKLIVMILRKNPFFEINGFYNGYEPPTMDLSKLCDNSSIIRFFENAFEWENMQYIFYPYFWGRRSTWANAIKISDNDPLFASFLKAGAARVQVPVRPGFESAIAKFSTSGILWNGQDIPIMDEELFVPLLTEIGESLGRPGDVVPYIDPVTNEEVTWEVTIPTSLVVLQDLNEVPNIRDVMTGENINLNP